VPRFRYFLVRIRGTENKDFTLTLLDCFVLHLGGRGVFLFFGGRGVSKRDAVRGNTRIPRNDEKRMTMSKRNAIVKKITTKAQRHKVFTKKIFKS
jgi:hypothetical protein